MSGEEEANFLPQWEAHQMDAANKLMMLAQSYANFGGRYDLTYLYASEAYEIVSVLPSAGERMVSSASKVRQAALELVIPAAKRWGKSKQSAAESSKKELASSITTTGEQGQKASTSWQEEVRQAGKAAMKLTQQSNIYAKEGRWDLAYVYANETYEIVSQLSQPSKTTELISAAMEARQCALHQLMPAAKRWEEAKQNAAHAESGEKKLASRLNRARNTSAINHSAYPSHVEVSSLDIFWDSRVKPASARMSCVLERLDQSVVEPAVGFFDLPEFFARHTGAGFSLDDLNIYFSHNEGVPPGDEHFRLLLQLASEKCRPTIFLAMNHVLVAGWPDFRNVLAATFKELFGEVLTALRYHFTDLHRLPEGIEPTDLLLYPPLLACQTVRFSVTPRHAWPAMWHARSNPPVIKFPAAGILAHLKGKSAASTTPASTAGASEPPPQLLIYDTYLDKGGVEALVEAIKQDFFKVDAAVPRAKEKGTLKKKKGKEEESRLYPFSLCITYRHATAFDLRHCGEWHNSLGERLRVCAASSSPIYASPNLVVPDEFHIEVRRTTSNSE